ncbi:hypothetical protein P3L10_012160 [Capsicum annuum]
MAMEQQFDGGFETHYQNSPGLVNNFNMGGPSNATVNLQNFNSSGPQYPSSVEAIDRFNDCGFMLTQLTEIVNNNDDVQGELDSDEPSQYESSDDDDDNNENVNGESTSVGVYTGNHSSITISYLDHTEESLEELRCMVNEIVFELHLKIKIILNILSQIPFYQSNMSFSAAEFPPLLSLIVIFAIIIVYIVFCYLVLELMDRHDNLNDDISRMDTARGSGLSISELQEISCFYLKEQQVNYSTCAICLDGLVDADLCRSFPACNHVFHAQCIDPWLAKKTTCPTCRTPFRPRFSFLK